MRKNAKQTTARTFERKDEAEARVEERNTETECCHFRDNDKTPKLIEYEFKSQPGPSQEGEGASGRRRQIGTGVCGVKG